LGKGKAQKVVTAHPESVAHIPTRGIGESVTAIKYIATDGWVISPNFLLQG
jgi:hypothetical protein